MLVLMQNNVLVALSSIQIAGGAQTGAQETKYETTGRAAIAFSD